MAPNTEQGEIPRWGRRMGEHFESARVRAGMSRAQLARRVSVSEESIRRWEKGGSRPSADRLAHVIAVLAIDTGNIISSSPARDERPDLARRLLVERRARGITQAQAARLLGVAQPTYAGWEIGRATPNADHTNAVATFLDASEGEVIRLAAAPFVVWAGWPPLGQLIGARRAGLRLRREDLANRLGVTPGTIAAWELGYRTPRPSRLRSLASTLSLSVEELELALARKGRPVCALGQLIQLRQRHLGLNLADLARRAELDAATLSRWIHGHHRPAVVGLRRLADVLEVSPTAVYEAAGVSE